MIAQLVFDTFGITQDDARQRVSLLTEQERRLCELMAQGLEVYDCMARLKLTKKCVYEYRFRVYTKLRTSPSGLGRIWFAANFGEE